MEIRKTKYGFLAAAFAAAIATVSACAGEDANADPHAAAATNAEAAQESEIPAAILGQAAPPRGEDLAYFEPDPSTVGYVVTPDGEGRVKDVNVLEQRVRVQGVVIGVLRRF